MRSVRSAALTPKQGSNTAPVWLLSVQIAVGVVVSVAAAFVSWQTHVLADRAEESNTRLKAIEQELAQSKFGFERTRDIYDRTEKYLSSPSRDQDEGRGRVLVALIGSIPDQAVRSQLLTVVTEAAKRNGVAAQAAKLNVTRPASATPNSATQPTPVLVTAASSQTAATGAGFSGVQQIAVDSETYRATTLAPIRFTDAKGRVWEVPRGTVTTGSSVPRILWSIVGPPLTSSYTTASILHEYYYREQSRPREEVDQMFFEALRASGVAEPTAKSFYQSVRLFGAAGWDAARKAQLQPSGTTQ